MALGPHTWAVACVRVPKHAYTGTFLHTQLEFQKRGNGKYFAIMAVV